jgi:hypothetical protein
MYMLCVKIEIYFILFKICKESLLPVENQENNCSSPCFDFKPQRCHSFLFLN